MDNFDHNIDPEHNFLRNIISNCEYYTDDEFNASFGSTAGLSIIHLNSQSMYTHFDQIRECLGKFKKPFNIVAVSESWITNEKGANFNLSGYDFICVNREDKRSGGVALYVDQNLNYKIIDSMSTSITDLLECITIEIDMGKKQNITVSCVYRAHDSCIETFKNVFEALFTKTKDNLYYICGDVNIDMLNPHKKKTVDDFYETMFSMSLLPLITKPTRVTSHSATVIDNIFTNNFESHIVSGLLVNDISDHLPIFVIFEHNTLFATKNPTRSFRVNSEESLTALNEDLWREEWKDVYSAIDVNVAFENFITKFQSILNKNCPVKTSNSKRKQADSPWITKGLQNACKKKNNLYRKFIKCRTPEAEMKYKTYKNKLTQIMRRSKKDYFNKQIEKNKDNNKGLWATLNNIIRKGSAQPKYPNHFIVGEETIEDTKDIATGFNDYFVNLGPSLAKLIPQTDLTSQGIGLHIDSNPNSMFIRPVEENEVSDIIKSCKSKLSTDIFDINMSVIKRVCNSIAKPFTYICNLSFSTALFPCRMKIAKINPLYKAGDRHLFSNYRPIALLPQFSKILEKVFITRLNSFIDTNNLLSDCQYGFRSGKSTALALIDLTEEIAKAVDGKGFALSIFLDLKRAFDTINYDVLICKLEKYGIRGQVLSWLRSYVTDRQQYVQLNNEVSHCRTISCGLPQGSVLAPLLFILYINDLCKLSSIFKCIVFADDTSIVFSGTDLHSLLDTASKELTLVQAWFHANRLSLNLDKTKFMISSNRQIDTNIQLSIGNVNIERVYEIKFLGVMVDSKLKWKAHIDLLRKKVSRSLAVLYKARPVLEQTMLRTLYCCFVLPYFNYCIEAWGSAAKDTLRPLVVLQKKAIRLVHKASFLEHTNPLFLESKALKLPDLYTFKVAQIMYRAKSHTLPGHIQNLFVDRDIKYDLRGNRIFRKNYARTDLKCKCISFHGLKIWDSIPATIRESGSLLTFKAKFKSMVLNDYLTKQN